MSNINAKMMFNRRIWYQYGGDILLAKLI